MEQFVSNESEEISISNQGDRQRYGIAVAGELAGFVDDRTQGDPQHGGAAA